MRRKKGLLWTRLKGALILTLSPVRARGRGGERSGRGVAAG